MQAESDLSFARREKMALCALTWEISASAEKLTGKNLTYEDSNTKRPNLRLGSDFY